MHIYKSLYTCGKNVKGEPAENQAEKNTYVNFETAFPHIMHLCLLRNFNNCHFSVIKKYASKHVLFPHRCSIVYESR